MRKGIRYGTTAETPRALTVSERIANGDPNKNDLVGHYFSIWTEEDIKRKREEFLANTPEWDPGKVAAMNTEERLALPVADLPFDAHLRHRLDEAGCYTLSDIVGTSHRELVDLPGINYGRMQKINKVLRECGFNAKACYPTREDPRTAAKEPTMKLCAFSECGRTFQTTKAHKMYCCNACRILSRYRQRQSV